MERPYQVNVLWKALAFWGVFFEIFRLRKRFTPSYFLEFFCQFPGYNKINIAENISYVIQKLQNPVRGLIEYNGAFFVS